MRFWALGASLATTGFLAFLGVGARADLPVVASKDERPSARVAGPRNDTCGSGSCSAAACHGGITEAGGRSRSSVAHTIWAVCDEKHPRAYQALLEERSKTIIKNLGWRRPTSLEPRWLC